MGVSSFDLGDIQISKIPKLKTDAKLPIINSRQYTLMDAESGYLIASQEPDKQVAIASMTKIMTAILTLENYKLTDVVEISSIAASTNGSDVQFRTKEKVSVGDLLDALLISSANDAAIALAEQSGSVEIFVEKMNKKAEELGLTNTRFKDPAGLDDNGYSTAKDIAVLTSYVIRKPEFRKIIKQPEKEIVSVSGIKHQLDNSNRLVKDEMFLAGVIGGKTGFTPVAGHNLTVAAERDGHTLIAVIINTYNNSNTASAEEAKKLLEWGFENLTY